MGARSDPPGPEGSSPENDLQGPQGCSEGADPGTCESARTDELQLQLLSCLTRVHRFQFAIAQAFSKSTLGSDDLNEILSAALSLEEGIAKMYAASGVAPSRSAAGG